MKPAVSVVIPTRNRPRLVAECVDSLVGQAYDGPFEVLVVDDGSTDRSTEAAVARFAGGTPPVRYLRQDGAGPNAARNRGIREASGDLICFVDDDVLAPPGWLAEVMAGADRHPEAGCLGGRILLRLEGTPPRMCGREALSEGEFDLGDVDREADAVYSGNMAIRRSAVALAGEFDETLPIYHEETEWEVRLRRRGGRIVYLPDAWLWHRRSADDLRLGRMLVRRFRYGYGSAAFARRTGGSGSAGRALARVPKLLGHAVRRRCWWGALAAAYQLGHAWGLVRRRRAA